MSEPVVPERKARPSMGGGRRWVPLYWMQGIEVEPGRWRFTGPDYALEEKYEYRMVYDASRRLWRLDRRSFVAGG